MTTSPPSERPSTPTGPRTGEPQATGAHRVDAAAVASTAAATSPAQRPTATPVRTPNSPGGGPAEPSLGELVGSATKDLSGLIKGEIALAKAELSSDVKAAGVGAGMFAGAGFFGIFALSFFSIALAEGLTALGLPRVASYAIVGLLYLIVTAILGLLGKARLKKVKPPERTIETTKDTVAWAKHPTQNSDT